jgi:hypothetical protein
MHWGRRPVIFAALPPRFSVREAGKYIELERRHIGPDFVAVHVAVIRYTVYCCPSSSLHQLRTGKTRAPAAGSPTPRPLSDSKRAAATTSPLLVSLARSRSDLQSETKIPPKPLHAFRLTWRPPHTIQPGAARLVGFLPPASPPFTCRDVWAGDQERLSC